jgi:serine/threonine-protein kinase
MTTYGPPVVRARRCSLKVLSYRQLRGPQGCASDPGSGNFEDRARESPAPDGCHSEDLPAVDSLQSALGDRYDLLREIGRGGMATVYLATDVRHDRTVAVKVLDSERSGALGADRFAREIGLAARLNHPHIVPVLDSGRVGDRLFFVMPYVEGESLRQYIQRRVQLSLEEAVRFAAEIGEALAYAHAHGLVHRDIKPENVLISSGHAVVCDFGVARALDEAADERLTQTGVTVGTSAYMSPEQWSGSDRIDGASDQYSLACTLYEMLTGEPPYTGATPQVIMARHIQAPVPSVRLLRPNVPEALESAIHRALSKVPADRYATAQDFVDDLRRAPTASTSPSPPAAPVRTRGRWVLPVPIGAGLAIIAFVGYQLLGPPTRSASTGGAPRVVVLPFDNAGDAVDAEFSDGVAEAITDQLAGIAGLRVIAYASAVQYRGTTNLREVTRDLNVAYAVQGTVRWLGPAGDRDSVRVSAKLIRLADGEQIWSQPYSEPAGEVFRVQSAVAEQIATALNVVLLERERDRLASEPTRDVEAWEYYIRGNAAHNRSRSRADVETALAMYQEAVNLDGTFALARAKLARTHAWTYRLRMDLSEDRLLAAKNEADRAVALEPDLPEAHLALGLYFYWGRRNYEQALAAFEQAGQSSPSDPQVPLQIGNVRRRQGQFDDAIESYRRAVDLDPRSSSARFTLGETLLYMREYEEAWTHLERVTELAPDLLEARLQQVRLLINRSGAVDSARDVLETAQQRVAPDAYRPAMVEYARIVYHPDLDDLLSRIAPGSWGLDAASYHSVKAGILRQLGRLDAARAQYDSARIQLQRLVEERPGEAWIFQMLAVAQAGLGNEAEAVRAATRARELQPITEDALDGPGALTALGTAHALLGNWDKATVYFDSLLAMPSWVSIHSLETEPLLADLRRTAAYEQLRERWLPDFPARTASDDPVR